MTQPQLYPPHREEETDWLYANPREYILVRANRSKSDQASINQVVVCVLHQYFLWLLSRCLYCPSKESVKQS